MKNLISRIQWLILILAILLPFAVIRIFPKFHHSYDLRVFRTWAEAWQTDWRDIYINCETCNYPFVGTLLSGGVMSTIDYKNVARVINRFRYYLAVIDAVNVLALWFILTRLQVRNAPLWAGVIGLLPSSWVSSSVWGQIDGIGQLLILLFFILLIWFNAKGRAGWQAYLYFLLAGLLLSLMLLTKQLIYFSLGALGLIVFVNIVYLSKNGRTFLAYTFMSAFTFLLPILLVDASLQLKPPYFSHIQYILATGSQHGDQIASLGFNIWTLFTKDLLGTSHNPLQIGPISLAPLTPFSTGYILFAILVISLLIIFVLDLRRQNTETKTFNRGQIISALIFFSLINLAFNLTLTGTHERYLYHFYPFMLMACLGLLSSSRYFNRTLLIVTFSGALFYGAYLFAYLSGTIRPTDQTVIQSAAVIHLCLFIYLFYSWIRNSNSQSINSSLS